MKNVIKLHVFWHLKYHEENLACFRKIVNENGIKVVGGLSNFTVLENWPSSSTISNTPIQHLKEHGFTSLKNTILQYFNEILKSYLYYDKHFSSIDPFWKRGTISGRPFHTIFVPKSLGPVSLLVTHASTSTKSLPLYYLFMLSISWDSLTSRTLLTRIELNLSESKTFKL